MNLRPLLLAFALTAPLLLGARADTGLADGPSEAQSTTTQLVHGLLSDSRYAYRPRPLDDAMSQDVFDSFLEALDGNKLFLTAQDVQKFAPYRTRLDDAIKAGDASPAWAMFAVYRQRVDERIAHARGLLKQGFDFDRDERWQHDREDAPWASAEELDALWRKSVKNDWLRLRLAGKDDKAIRETLDKRYANLSTSVRQLNGDDVFQTFMNAYAGAIDPHTSYFNPRSAALFNQSMSLSLEGIGAQLQKQDDVVVIREIIAGGPAAMDKRLKSGDRIVGVGQGASGPMEDVIGWRIDDVVDKIKGPKGTRVRLDVVPAAAALDGPPSRVELTRARIRLEEQAAKSKLLTVPLEGGGEQRIGVIELPTFYQDFEGRRKNNGDYASATRDVARLLQGFRKEGVDGVVLDLRNNGGGSLNEAVELTGLFIDKGPVVQVRSSGGRVAVERDGSGGTAWDGPLAVLINRGSASASEIFAGAIQDYGRGLVIGEQSFGKGTVQNLFDLDRWPASEQNRFGQVKFTMAQFFRISGGSTQHRGVVPDIRFPITVDANEFGESTYDNALPWTRIAAVEHRHYGNFAPLLPRLGERHEARIAQDREFQWWVEDVERFREEKARGWISLNEAERRAERKADAERRVARQAERKRLGLPLDPLAETTLDDGLQASERDILEDVAREEAAEERPDPLLRASAAILADAVVLLGEDGQLSAQVLPGAKSAGRWTD